MKAENAEHSQPAVRAELDKMAAQFKAALPSHISVEKFVRIVLTSVNSNPDLTRVASTLEGRRSLFEAATKAAQDGLLPDGREGAFVVYNVNTAKRGQPARYAEMIRWMPMVAGICKKVRNSGEIKTIDAVVVYEKDEYESWIDENGPHFKHKRSRSNRGNPILTYAYAATKDGGFFFEELNEGEIQAIRSVSRAKDSGPWAGPFSDEMRRKSAIRRLAKYRLPSSADVDEVIRRDDDLYDLNNLDTELPKIDMPRRQSEAKEEPSSEELEKSEVPREQVVEEWIRNSPEDEFMAVDATQFERDCHGIKGDILQKLAMAYNERRLEIRQRQRDSRKK